MAKTEKKRRARVEKPRLPVYVPPTEPIPEPEPEPEPAPTPEPEPAPVVPEHIPNRFMG